MNLPPTDCCGQTRRDFLKTTAGLAAASAFGGLPLIGRAETPAPKSETLVATLFKSLREDQRKALCFPFDHALRTEVDNNWHITDQHIAAFLDKDQKQMVKEIFLGLHSPEYAETVLQAGRARQRQGGLRRFVDRALRRARHRASSNSCSPAGTAPGAATATRWKARRLADRSSTDTPRRASTKSPIIPATSIGIRRSGRTRFSRCSTASSARWRCSAKAGWSKAPRP